MYTVISAVKNLFRNPFINLTVIVSLTLGLLFPMLVFCIGNVLLKEIWSGLAYSPERTAGLYTDNEIRIDTEKAMEDHPQIELMVEGAFAQHDYAVLNEKFIRTEIAGYKTGSNQLARYEILYGRYLTDSEANGEERVCIISTTLQKELGCAVESKITFGREDFTVKGVYISKSVAAIIPLDTFLQKYDTMYTYTIRFKNTCNMKTEGVEIMNRLADEYGISNRDFILMSDHYKETNDLQNAYFALSILLAVASVILVYAALNISNILVNKINADRRNYIIKMRLGASRGSIFGFLWVQLLILMLISVGIDIVIVLLLKKFMPYIAVFPFDLNPLAVLLTALIGTAYVLVLTSALVKKVFAEKEMSS